MSSATYYKWRSKFGGVDACMISRLKELEAENIIQSIQSIQSIQAWAKDLGIELQYIQPRKPQQNGLTPLPRTA